MKLLQLNIWRGTLMPKALQLIKAENPDILCLQELCSSDGKTVFFDNLQDIQARLDYPFVAYAPVFDWSMMDANVAYGNAILSKYPITEQHTEFVSGKYIAGFHFAYDNHNSARNFVHATITDEREIYQILTHHGYYHPDSKRGDDSSQRQMEQLGEYLDTLSGSIILTGDFNLEPDTVSLAEINHRLRNLTVEFQAPTTRNLLAKRKTEIIDYIFVSDNIKVKSFRVADEIVSDHQALILEI